jgi:hypothetical protein
VFDRLGGILRLIGAGVFVFVGLLLMVGVVGSLDGFNRAPGWFVSTGMAGWIVLLMLVSIRLFQPRESSLARGKSYEQQVRELESQGLLESAPFRATRAFAVGEMEDEGSHYFIELEDGGVLYLNGQYLYDYEPIDDDPELNQARSFPCTEFTVRRHKTERFVVDISCGGNVLEPEIIAPAFKRSDWKMNRVPEDGQVVRDRGFEALLRERVG